MTDIVERLRERSQFLWTNEQQLSDNKLAKEAADEIERLRYEYRILYYATREVLTDAYVNDTQHHGDCHCLGCVLTNARKIVAAALEGK